MIYTRCALPNGLSPTSIKMPTSNFSIRFKLYYIAPSAPSKTDAGFWIDYYARTYNNVAAVASTSNFTVRFNTAKLASGLAVTMKVDGITYSAGSGGSNAWGLNQTGFKTLVVVIDSAAGELRVYANGLLLMSVSNNSQDYIDFANGIGSTGYSPLVVEQYSASSIYLQSMEIFDEVLEGDDLL